MKLLLILLSVMTFMVETKNSVSASGIWPYDMQVTFDNNSSQGKGHVGKNDVAAFNVTELGGITIEKIDVYIKSNKESGAGNIEARVHQGLTTLGTKTGSFKDWTGSFDDTKYHAITIYEGSVPNVYDVSIQLIGTENSLHIEKYEITWASAPARTVTLMKGSAVYSTLTEESGGEGVMLPALADSAEWHFIGWSETEFWETNMMPTVLSTSDKYYPSHNCSLWAVYKYQVEPEEVYLTELKSGKYVYVNTMSNHAMAGVPTDKGTMERVNANTSILNQQYNIEFNATCDSATIQHVPTNTYIGFNATGTKLVAQVSKWCVFHDGDKTGFYMNYQNKSYILWTDLMDSYEQEYTGLMGPIDVTTTPTALMLIPEKPEKDRYTCHPEGGEAPTETLPIIGTEKEFVVSFGLYELHIINGQKYLRLKQ